MRVGIVLFPFPFSPSPTSQHPCPPPPPKKKLWPPDWMKWKFLGLTLKTLYNQHVFDLSPMVLFVHFLSGPQGCFGPQQSCVFTSLPLCSGCSPGCPFSYPVYLTNPCPFLKIQMKCCLSPYISLHSFPTHFISPTSPPIHNPLNDSIIHTVL